MFQFRRLCAASAALLAAATLAVRTHAQQDPFPEGAVFSQALADMNAGLAGRDVRIDSAEIFVSPDAGWSGATTLIANDRTHTIGSLFVARDPRRGGFDAISYLVDQSDGSALAFANPTGPAVVTLPNSVTEPILDAAMTTWDVAPHCPGPPVVKVADNGTDPDLIDGIVFGDPSRIGTPQADITHAGWLPPAFFNAIAPPNGASFILGVTFTFIFVDGLGNPTDIDHDGTADTAFREIYYNRGFGWSEGPSRPRGVDILSVATHESGHAFGLGHFGKVFIDNKGRIKFAPRAVMNAVYVSPFSELAGTDNASYCQIWAHRK
jgi:hypothetical protein